MSMFAKDRDHAAITMQEFSDAVAKATDAIRDGANPNDVVTAFETDLLFSFIHDAAKLAAIALATSVPDDLKAKVTEAQDAAEATVNRMAEEETPVPATFIYAQKIMDQALHQLLEGNSGMPLDIERLLQSLGLDPEAVEN